MQDFNYRKAENEENCGNCYMGIRHLTRGLLCGYTDAPTLRDHRCGLYIMQQEKEKTKTEGQPVALYKWLLSRYAKPGDKILDTHGGSGSICIACHDLGFDLTWMELDEDYYNAAVKRYKDHAAQATLFNPVELTKETQGGLF